MRGLSSLIMSTRSRSKNKSVVKNNEKRKDGMYIVYVYVSNSYHHSTHLPFVASPPPSPQITLLEEEWQDPDRDANCRIGIIYML